MYPRHILHWIDDARGRVVERRDVREALPDRRPRRRAASRAARPPTSTAPSTRAAAAAESWGRLPAPRRGEILGRAAALLRAREREFGEIVQTETGKPWKNAVAEVGIVRRSRRLHGERRQPLLRQDDDEPDRRTAAVRTMRAPIGVCAAIMPFNSPLAGIAWKVFPALLCGNAVVVEVARADAVHRGRVRRAAAGSGSAARPLLRRAGIRPRGRHAARPGSSRRPRQLHRIGRRPAKLIQQTVSGRAVLAKVCLELGGKNPLVVCDDADLTLAARARGGVGVHRRRPAVRGRQPDHRVRRRLRRVPRRRCWRGRPRVKVGSGPRRRLRTGDFAREPRSPAGRRRARGRARRARC